MSKSSSAIDLERFAPLGITRERDFLIHLPLRYVDLTQIVPIAQTFGGVQWQVEGTVFACDVVPRPRRHLSVTVRDASGELKLRFLSFYPSQLKQMAVGSSLRIHGMVRSGLFGREMVHPVVKKASDTPPPQTLTPIYPAVAGIAQPSIRKAIDTVLADFEWAETLPANWIAPLGLMHPKDALIRLHHPPAGCPLAAFEERSDPAWQRVIFDELLAQQISLRLAREQRAKQNASALPSDDLVKQLVQALPFELTGAQQRVWRQISDELRSTMPMNRLLQGDVGSGKTIVSAMAACQAIGSGQQAALMAPTEILAEQHFRKLSGWLTPLGVHVAWLAGSVKESEKKLVRAACASGEIDLLIGTHAVIQDSVQFARLGLAIVDEQHRFGVKQRIALRTKQRSDQGTDRGADRGADLNTDLSTDQQAQSLQISHQLMMSATPIPRTLAMSYYADLDVSVIDELPPGRTPIVTKLLSNERRGEVIDRVAWSVGQGSQVYWVCPLIDESETLQLQTAIETFEQLRVELPDLKIGLIHGKLPPAEKAHVMAQFSAGDIQLLVATTVIEVGVDVPKASLMIIEHAERFGLAQLHQLRGRVGRGTAQSTCVLLFQSPLSQMGKERLKIIFSSTDGFEIARRDLELRGPGEFLGARQSGQALLRFADLERDTHLLEAASHMSVRLLQERPDLARAHMDRWFARREDYLKS